MKFYHQNYSLPRKNAKNRAEMLSNSFETDDVTIFAYLPPSLVTLCHQNLQILATSLPPLSGDVIFEQPLKCNEIFTCDLSIIRVG